MNNTIYVIEDDDNIRELVVYALSTAGFDAKGFQDGGVLNSMQDSPCLILLDIMLPGTDGISLLKKLKARDATKDIPVIMLTAKGSEIDRVKGLNLGADDYIPKPFSVIELVARVRAVLRRSSHDAPETVGMKPISHSGITLNLASRTVQADGQDVRLTYKEFELLHCLMRNKDTAMSRSLILQEVWGYDYLGESRTVDMHIKSLRQKLGSLGSTITTVRGVGYKM